MAVKPTPAEYQAAIPYLTVQPAADAIAFYQQAFNATELTRLADSMGKIPHTEIKIEDVPLEEINRRFLTYIHAPGNA